MLKKFNKYKKVISIFCATLVLFTALPIKYIAYADTIKTIEENEDVLLNEVALKPNARYVGALAPLVSMATPGLTKIMQIFMLSLVTAQSYDKGLVSLVLTVLQNLTSRSENVVAEITAFMEKQLENAHSVTIAFLIAYENFVEDTGKIADDVRTQLSEYFTETFLVQLESALAKGVDLATLATYGVTRFLKPTLYEDVYNSLPPSISNFPTMYGDNIVNVGANSSVAYRFLTPLPNDPYAVSYPKYRIPCGIDPNMSFVDTVQITKNGIESYNYGWQGLTWIQQYYMKPALDGITYMLVFGVAKALSPNQIFDYNHDGVSFGLYQVDETGAIVSGNANNRYYRGSDARLNVSVPAIGTNLYKSGSVNLQGLRDICADLWGEDIFPGWNDVLTTNNVGVLGGNRLVDYSKNEPGIYDNNWNLKGKPVFPLPGVDDTISFPTFKPGQGYGDVVSTPGDIGADVIFPPGTWGDSISVNPGSITVPTDTDLDLAFPDVMNPDIPSDTPSDTPADTPSVPSVPSLDWTWLKNLLNSILDFFNNFWDNLLNFITGLFVPSDDFFTNKFDEFKNKLEEKVPNVNVGKLEELAQGNKTFKDVYANIMGQNVLVLKLSVIEKIIGFTQPILQGLIAIYLLLYNYNQIYFMIRGSSLVGAKNTINNYRSRKIGGRE